MIGSGLVSPATLDLPLEDFGAGNARRSSAPARSSSTERDARHRDHADGREDYDWGPASSSHQGRAYLDGIKIIVTPEDSVRIGALLAGQARLHPPGPGL